MNAAKPHDQLIAELLDSRIPKNEHGWAAAREIESLRSRQACEGDKPYVCHALATVRARLADAESDRAAYKGGFEAASGRADILAARIALIIGYCAQEGHDGEPYDTINAIATGEYSTRGGGRQPVTVSGDSPSR